MEHGIVDIQDRYSALKQSFVYVRGTTQPALANDTATKVVLDDEQVDIRGEFDPTTNYRFTAEESGIYLVNWQVMWTNGGMVYEKNYDSMLYKNGVWHTNGNTMSNAQNGATAQACVGTCIIQLAATQYLEIFAIHLAAAATPVVGNSRFEVARIA